VQGGHGITLAKRTFDIKFDGYRCIAVKRGREVALFSRNEKVLNKRFPKIVQALASLEGDFVLDGELVALDSQGKPSFQLLQNNLSAALPVYFYAFDLLNRDAEFGEPGH
jgi:bifunctional non-homologous end joining protein LigD